MPHLHRGNVTIVVDDVSHEWQVPELGEELNEERMVRVIRTRCPLKVLLVP